MQHWVYAGIHLYLHLPAIYAYSYTNSASSVANRDCDFHTDTQTNPHPKTPSDTEAAADSAAKARRSPSQLGALASRGGDSESFRESQTFLFARAEIGPNLLRACFRRDAESNTRDAYATQWAERKNVDNTARG